MLIIVALNPVYLSYCPVKCNEPALFVFYCFMNYEPCFFFRLKCINIKQLLDLVSLIYKTIIKVYGKSYQSRLRLTDNSYIDIGNSTYHKNLI